MSDKIKAKVFISYAHDNDDHRARVLKLAQKLRRSGVECMIDQFLNGSPHEGWSLWMARQIKAADFVLVVGSERYIARYELTEREDRGAGAKWEGGIIRSELYWGGGYNSKFIPIIFDGSARELIPQPLWDHSTYRMFDDFQKLLRVLTKQPAVRPEPVGKAPDLPAITYADTFTKHRMEIERRAKNHDWWDQAIPLNVVPARGGKSTDARSSLAKWMATGTTRHCIVLGDPGAGKTGLLWWAAATLAEKKKTLPVFVSASQLRALDKITFLGICNIAEPRLTINSESELHGNDFYLVLDGLDELIGATAGSDRAAIDLLTTAFRVIPPSSRVLAACRTPAFALVKPALKSTLPNGPSDRSRDRYDQAIARALGTAGESTLILEVGAVSRDRAKTFLERKSVADDLIEAAVSSSSILPFLSSPFSLRMLAVALPRLVSETSLAVDDLYRIYVRSALFREDERLTDEELGEITTQLRRLAFYLTGFAVKGRLSAGFQHIAERAGLVVKTGGQIGFSHYSLLEYFFASELFDEISNYDSHTMAQLDLVGGYNINRMLLPMMQRSIERKATTAHNLIKTVSVREYQEFLSHRRWRKQTGYGIHPSVTRGSDGTPSATFSIDSAEIFSIHKDRSHGNSVASALSWYDAAVFALHAGVRIPTSSEIVHLHCKDDYLFWCADWHTEEAAHVFVYDAKRRELHGLNPDVRLPRTALAVTG